MTDLNDLTTSRDSSRNANNLYNDVDGKTRWAWIDGADIKAVGYYATNPNEMDDQKALGRTWLPVLHFDSEVFDPATHWRLKPVITIEGDYVRCTYPVVSKTAEAV